MGTEAYSHYIEKMERHLAEKRRKDPLILKGLADFAENYTSLAKMFLSEKISRTHLIGLKVALTPLCKSRSNLGILSESFERSVDLLTNALLQRVVKSPSKQTEETLGYWIQLTIVIAIGLLEAAKEEGSSTKKDVPIDTGFRNELLLLLIFYTEYPRHLFKQMAEALGIEISHHPLFISSLEALALLVALYAIAKNPGELNVPAVENMTPRLLQDLETISKSIDPKATSSAGISDERTVMFLGAALEEMRLALERGELEELTRLLVDFLEDIGYSKENFSNDLAEIKKLFLRFKTAYQESQENKSTLVNLVG